MIQKNRPHDPYPKAFATSLPTNSGSPRSSVSVRISPNKSFVRRESFASGSTTYDMIL